jgi:hypothetical protein
VLLLASLLLLQWLLLTFPTTTATIQWMLLVVLWLCALLCSIYLHRHGLNLTLLTNLTLRLLVKWKHTMAALSRLPCGCSCCSWPPRCR